MGTHARPRSTGSGGVFSFSLGGFAFKMAFLASTPFTRRKAALSNRLKPGSCGQIKLHVRFVNETVWLTQLLMADLFRTTPENVPIHLRNIYNESELEQNATTKAFLVVARDGVKTSDLTADS